MRVILFTICLSVTMGVNASAENYIPRGQLIGNDLDYYSKHPKRGDTVYYDQHTANYFSGDDVDEREEILESSLNRHEGREEYLRSVLNPPKARSRAPYQRKGINVNTVEDEPIKQMTKLDYLIKPTQRLYEHTGKMLRYPINATGQSKKLPRGSIAASSGYREDKVDWSIAGKPDGTGVSVLSEYIWPKVEFKQTKVEGELVLADKYVFDADFAHSVAFDGHNFVSEYDGDGRTNKVVEVETESNKGEAFDGSLGMGLLVDLKRKDTFKELDSLTMKMLGGYSYHLTKLTMRNGVENIGSDPGPFDGLNSTYDMEWQGPWMGLEFAGERKKLTSLARLKYHNFKYYAEGDLNLQPAYAHPKSFDHNADGEGYTLDLGVGYKLAPSWAVNLMWSYKDWQVEQGSDRLYLSDGSYSDTLLNEVNHTSQSVMLGSQYDF